MTIHNENPNKHSAKKKYSSTCNRPAPLITLAGYSPCKRVTSSRSSGHQEDQVSIRDTISEKNDKRWSTLPSYKSNREIERHLPHIHGEIAPHHPDHMRSIYLNVRFPLTGSTDNVHLNQSAVFSNACYRSNKGKYWKNHHYF